MIGNSNYQYPRRLSFGVTVVWRVLALSFVCMLVAGVKPARADSSTAEYRVKAAFLYNFSKFVEWPAAAMGDSDRPFVIGVCGDDPFGSDLNKTVEGKTVEGRPYSIKRFRRAADIQSCHILFISESEKSKAAKIIDNLQNAHTLVVGDTDGFIQRGGAINFIIEDKKVRFEINPEAVSRAGLKVSSKLLALAKIVKPRRG